MAGGRKSKKARTEAPAPLGSKGKLAQKDENELELEEAVFGKSRGGKGSVWDSDSAHATFQEEEIEFEGETGLDRVEDDAVSRVSFLRD